MSIQDKINLEIKNAMKEKNINKLAALRAVKSALLLEATKDRKEHIDDTVSLKIISKLVKQRKDSAKIFLEKNRNDLANEELEQLKYLENYLPVQMTKEEIKKIIDQVIIETNSSSLSDIGKCMGILIQRTKGKADGALISRILKESLSS
tara:strand:+ start:558 stop:1007 length:450 start_codon:yes stop_codon:yes gene_type:complete